MNVLNLLVWVKEKKDERKSEKKSPGDTTEWKEGERNIKNERQTNMQDAEAKWNALVLDNTETDGQIYSFLLVMYLLWPHFRFLT